MWDLDETHLTLLVGALFHDIGKFWQRAGVKIRHQELSREFVKNLPLPPNINRELLLTITLRHHDRKDLPDDLCVRGLPSGSLESRAARIIHEADMLSPAMDRESDEESETQHPLIPIFTEVRLSGKGIDRGYYIEPRPLSPNLYLPREGAHDGSAIQQACKSSWQNFEGEIRAVPTGEFSTWFNTVYYVLKKYTPFVLSAGYQVRADISLFDHLKTTAAIADCIYRYSKSQGVSPRDPSREVKRFLLIEGDLSGIQDFIFKVSSPAEARKGMAKRLRGRSFSLILLMEAVVRKIQNELTLFEPNVLWNTGGHFFILVTNLEENVKKLETLREEVNTEFLRRYNGDLYLALNWVDASSKDLIEFERLKNRVEHKTNLLKKRKFIDSLDPTFFDPTGGNIPLKDQCVICRLPVVQGKDQRTCRDCNAHERVGQQIARMQYIVESKPMKTEEEFELKFFETTFSFVNDPRALKDYLKGLEREGLRVFKINDTEFLDPELTTSNPDATYGFKFMGKVVPLQGNEVVSFDDLAQYSKGGSKLGILKMDVDNLGDIISMGLQLRKSISRVHGLSSMLDLFFMGYLNDICKKYYLFHDLCRDCLAAVKSKGGRTVTVQRQSGPELELYELDDQFACSDCIKKKIFKPYVIYSGGDDLLIVGPWDVTIELATEIRNVFKQFTCNNEDLNISAGIAIVDSKYPISRAVRSADDLLTLAKSHLLKNNTDRMKNSIAIFNECVCWDDRPGHQKKGFISLFELARFLESEVEKKTISKSFVYSLLDLWMLSFRKCHGDLARIEKARNVRHNHVPLLKYKLARTFGKDIKKRELYEDKIKSFMPWIRIPVSWTSLRTR